MIKIGDKVRCHHTQVYGGNSSELPVGYEGVVTHVSGMFIGVDNKLGRTGEPVLNSEVFEIIKEEKQMSNPSRFNLETQPWKIYVNNEAEYNAANEWLKEKLDCSVNCRYFDEIIAISNIDSYDCIRGDLMWLGKNHDLDPRVARHEIKLKYKTTVDSVEYPTIETDKQRKIRELKETIEKAQQQISAMQEE